MYGAVGASGWTGNRICMLLVYIHIHMYIYTVICARGQELVNGCCFCSLSASIYSLVLHSASSPCHVLQFILHFFALQPTLIFGGVFFVPFICNFLKVVACVFCFCFLSFTISLRWLKVPKADLWMREYARVCVCNSSELSVILLSPWLLNLINKCNKNLRSSARQQPQCIACSSS